MDAASWAAIVGPITTLLGGLGGYWLAGRNDEARDRRAAERESADRRAAFAERLEEDRHNFQRDTLLELQDQLHRLVRATTRILLQDEKTLKERGQLYLLPGELDAEEFQAFANIRRLWARVLDPNLRDSVEGFTNVCSRAGMPVPTEDKDLALAELRRREAAIGASYEQVNGLLGELLRRELDRRYLAVDRPESAA